MWTDDLGFVNNSVILIDYIEPYTQLFFAFYVIYVQGML